MGMDVHGENPKINKKLSQYPIFTKYKDMDYKEKWKILDTDEKIREKFCKEQRKYEEDNVGVYFRNSWWSWRPLWDYCYQNSSVITEEDWEKGHHNNGHLIDEDKAIALGTRLYVLLESGLVKEYQTKYTEEQMLAEEKGDKWATHYLFCESNVKRFADFCLESGGFRMS